MMPFLTLPVHEPSLQALDRAYSHAQQRHVWQVRRPTRALRALSLAPCLLSVLANAGCGDQIRPEEYGGAEIGGWSFAELSQLHNDLDLVRQDVEQRLSLLNQEAPKLNQYQAQVAAANRGGRGRAGGGQRKKRKTDEAGYADSDAVASPRAGPAPGTSDRSVGSGRGRGKGGRGGGRKRKKKREDGDEDGNEEEDDEEENAAPEEDVETLDYTAFWAMIDQQYCDPSPQDIEMLTTIRTTGGACFLRHGGHLAVPCD